MPLGVGSRLLVAASRVISPTETIGSPLKFSIIEESIASGDEFLTTAGRDGGGGRFDLV